MAFTTGGGLGRALLCAASTMVLAMQSAPAWAQANESQEIAIEAQPLDQTLVAIGERYGITIAASDALTQGKTAPSVTGNLTARQAIERALRDSGLKARRSVNGGFVVEATGAAVFQDVIVVTGFKVEKSQQDIQTSTTVFNEERIEQEALFSLDDALLRAPNVSVSNARTGFALRGINQSGVGFAGTGQTSQVYVDGVPLSTDGQQGIQSLWDVGQVEILLGPQSTVQGRNTLAGALVVNTLDPTYEWEVRGRVQGASQDTQRISAAVSGPIIADQLAFRIAYDYQHYDGDITEITTGTPQDFETAHTIRGKLLFEPEAIPGLRVELTGEYIDTEFGEFNTVFSPVGIDDPAFADFDPFGGETFTRIRLENPQTTKAIANIEYVASDTFTFVALGTFEDNLRDRQFGNPVNGQVSLFDSPADTQTWSAELRTEMDFGRLTGWVGAYYFDSEQVTNLNFTTSLAVAGAPFPFDPPGSTISIITSRTTGVENYAVFGDFTYELTDSLRINVGARYDWEDFSDSGNIGSVVSDPPDCVFTLPSGPLPCANIFPAQSTPGAPASFEAFLPRGAIIYDFDEDRSLSLSAARGYRAGGATLRQIPELGISDIVAFDPEFVTTYELAFRSQWFDRKLTVNANIFFTDWTDQQVSIPGPSGVATDTIVANAGESEIYGAELTVNYRPRPSLSFFATLGLLESEFTDFPFAFVPGPFANLAGNEFPNSPGITASGGFSYSDDSGFYISASGSYVGSQESDVANLPQNALDDYFLVNGRVGFRKGHFDLYVFGNNVFNERFITRQQGVVVNTGTGNIDTLTNARFEVNEPVIAGIGVDFNF